MFAFNFPAPSSGKGSKKAQVDQTIEDVSEVVCQGQGEGGDTNTHVPEEIPAEEISVDARFTNTEAWRRNIHTCKDGTPVHYYHCRDVEERLCAEGNNVVAQAFQQNSDLVQGVYEGGLKVWECSVDLVDYLSKLELVLREREVLELGCGVALPGLYALSHQANVTFQDYNEEVLTHCTMPNSVLNLPADKVEQSCHFYCGGWKSFTSLLEFQGKKFDIILTSETIYRPSDYPTLHNLFNKLASEAATIYVAGKVFYFGLGGGSKDFAEFVKQQDVFSVETTATKKKGVLREVLVLKRKSCLEHITLPP